MYPWITVLFTRLLCAKHRLYFCPSISTNLLTSARQRTYWVHGLSFMSSVCWPYALLALCGVSPLGIDEDARQCCQGTSGATAQERGPGSCSAHAATGHWHDSAPCSILDQVCILAFTHQPHSRYAPMHTHDFMNLPSHYRAKDFCWDIGLGLSMMSRSCDHTACTGIRGGEQKQDAVASKQTIWLETEPKKCCSEGFVATIFLRSVLITMISY